MRQRDLVTYPTWERYVVLSHVVSHMALRDRRAIIHSVRSNAAYSVPDAFFPNLGLTLAEFAVWYAIGEPRTSKPSRTQKLISKGTTEKEAIPPRDLHQTATEE